jgi:hypothetical protein
LELKGVTFSKFEQAITVLNFSHTCAEFFLMIFMRNSVSAKISLHKSEVENILGDMG